jgi:hypothetical protein
VIKIRVNKIQFKPIQTVSRRTRRGFRQLEGYLPSRVLRSLGSIAILRPYFISVMHRALDAAQDVTNVPHPLVIRINWRIEYTTTFAYSKNNRYKLQNRVLWITRALVAHLNLKLQRENTQWRVYWYSAGVSRHRNEFYSLVTLRHVDPMLEVLVTH